MARSTAAVPQDEFDHPYVTVDLVTLTADDEGLHLLVLERDEEPLGWALPGAFVQMDEDVTETASRVAREKLGLQQVTDLIALRPFGTQGRDPRRRVITLPHLALRQAADSPSARALAPFAASWARIDTSADDGVVCTIEGTEVELVFDHEQIVREAVRELRRRVQLDDPMIYRRLLPDTFTLRHLQAVHEALIGQPVNRDSFRRRVLMSGRLDQTDERETDVDHRPANLYRWREHA